MLDVVNCGPRARFVIAAGGAPLIVHNCENVTQAFARDCLAVSMMKVYDAGYQMIMLVHDEIVFDLLLGFGSLKEVLGVMAEEIPFAKGLPLKGAGYDDAPFFYKD